VQAACVVGESDRPKSEFDGGGAVARNEPYVIAQPVSFGVWQSGMSPKGLRHAPYHRALLRSG
jgi:hypothetical protein